MLNKFSSDSLTHSVFKGTGLHPEIKNENRCDDMKAMYYMISKKKYHQIKGTFNYLRYLPMLYG